MSDPLDELDHILDALEATKSKTAEDQERARIERDAQTAAFANWAETVVVPTLEPSRSVSASAATTRRSR